MSTPTVRTHRPAATHDQVLYQVVHPADVDRDEWTQDYERAMADYARFVRDYGGAHLHVVTLHAAQYDGECLQRFDARAAR
jgi:hypothetical protein